MLNEAMERFIKEHEKEAYDLLLTIAKIPSPSNHEEKRAQFCCNWLKEQGAEGVYIDEALNVVYPAALRDNVDVYMAHTDVVFPDETELPLKVENGRICCPGVGDDTACLVCVLLAAKYTALMIKEGKLNQIRPETEPGLIFVCNSGEEGLGNLKGVKKICEDYGSRMSTFCTFDGSLEHLVDEAVGSNRYKVTVRTQGGHSFGNFGRDNAIEKLAGIIEKLVSSGYAVRKGKQILPSTEGRELVNVMPAYLKSAAMTAEWENQLLMMEKGQITDTQFMGEITSLVGKILSVCREIPETERRRFQKAREVIGKCPVCGSDVYEGKQNFYCSNRQCDFALWKENRFLGSMEKTLDKKMAVELLDKACTHVKGLYSRKKDIKFDADLLLTLEDGKPRFHLEFPKKKKK